MKRFLVAILFMAIVTSFNACGSNPNVATESRPAEEVQAGETAEENLNDFEKQIYDALLIMIQDNFYNPASARLLAVPGGYWPTSEFDDSDFRGGDTVLVRVQGENRVGGTLSHTYVLVLKKGENPSEHVKEFIDNYGYTDVGLKVRYYGDVGDYAEIPEETEDYVDGGYGDRFPNSVDIGKINKALIAHWEELGLA